MTALTPWLLWAGSSAWCHLDALSWHLLPEMLIQWVEVERGRGTHGRAVLTCPCEAAHASGCRGHQNSSHIISPPLLNTSEEPGREGPALQLVNTSPQKLGQGSPPACGKKYWTNCQVESRLPVQVEMVAGVSTVEASGGGGNAMLGGGGNQALPSPRVGRGRKQGRIHWRNFLVVFHNDIVMPYH